VGAGRARARLVTVGVSTGGAYALAVASATPRVIGSVACCALGDMSWADGKALMMRNNAAIADIWSSPDREAALAFALESFGPDGSKLFSAAGSGPPLPPADLALLTDPEWIKAFMAGMPVVFAHGVQGYADDRLADGPGWGSFDVTRIRCPVIVLHGGSDSIVPVAHAHHTAKIVPGAKLRVFDALGHFSIVSEVLGAIRDVSHR
jgi:pimeloyl-ACP methyl ester carboxylesterase